MVLRVAIHGAAGRMGRALVDLIAQADLKLAAAIDAPGSVHIGRDAGELSGIGALGVPVTDRLDAIATADVVIDFSLPVALPGLLKAVEAHARPLVLATTGLSTEQWGAVDALAKRVPLVAAPNYSTGVAVLYHLAEVAARLVPDFDLEIVEMHHRHKVDAPSGTAIGLAEAAARGRDWNAREQSVYGREGRPGARTDKEIGVMALRGGDVIGDHTLIMAGEGERLEIAHKATSRVLFARGALRAARWVVGKAPGRYGMPDVLGLT